MPATVLKPSIYTLLRMRTPVVPGKYYSGDDIERDHGVVCTVEEHMGNLVIIVISRSTVHSKKSRSTP